jgi:hypothetical protein
LAIGWYYGHDENKVGPFSVQQLKDLAASGAIMPTDTVWKDGVDAGVVANRVRYLFASPPPPSADSNSLSEAAPVEAEVEIKLVPLITEPPTVPAPPEQAKAPTKMEKRGTATVIKGAILAGQDGAYARYRMKCTTCGHIDSSCRTIQITNKTTKANFFCPKCKKGREVVVQCRLG